MSYRQRACPAQNIDCSVMISMEHKATTNTPMLAHGQRFLNPVAATRTILRRERGGNDPHSSASVLSFALECQKEGSPGRITDGFSQMMVLDHARDIQIFDRDFVKLANDLKAEFVEKVASLIGHALMFASENPNGLAPIRAAQFLLAHFTLGDFQIMFSHSKIFGIINNFACREGRKALKSNVNPYYLPGFRNETGLIFFDGEDYIPAGWLPFNRTGFNFALDRARQPKPNVSYLSQMQYVASEPEPTLRICERIVSTARSKSWVTRFFAAPNPCKKRQKRFIQSVQCVLAYLAIHGGNFRVNLAHVGQFAFLFKKPDRLALKSVGFRPFLKPCVVELLAYTQPLLEYLNDALRRLSQLVFVCFQRLQVYLKSNINARNSRFSAMGLIYPRLKPGVLRPAG